LGQLRPGDLVFVPGADGTMTAPGHVGIYLGDGLIIDAPTTGQVVHIGQLQPYWTTNLAGSRRVANSQLLQPMQHSCIEGTSADVRKPYHGRPYSWSLTCRPLPDRSLLR